MAEDVEAAVEAATPRVAVTEPGERQDTVVRAAGGIVWRDRDGTTEGRDVEILLVHRPRYDDWTLPKGKLLSDEDERTGALREVEEETGLRCELIRPVGRVRYRDRFDRPKTVDYFEMRPREGRFVPGNEVDQVQWLPLPQAADALTYPHDRELLQRFGGPGVPLHLVRHAAAGERTAWPGPDAERPLTPKGWAQARAIADGFRDVPLASLFSSPFVRCVQSFEPLARATGLRIREAGELAEGTPPDRALAFMRSVAGGPAALCSHGDVIEGVVRRLLSDGVPSSGDVAFAKGSTWVIRMLDAEPVGARYLRAPDPIQGS
jgi:8-oxo-dGTP diphosphatase